MSDQIPPTTMSRSLAEQWELAKQAIRGKEGDGSFNGYFRQMRFYGRQEDGTLVFSQPTPFTAGRSQLWVADMLKRNLEKMGRYVVLVDDRMNDTPEQRDKFNKRYFAKFLLEQPPVVNRYEPAERPMEQPVF